VTCNNTHLREDTKLPQSTYSEHPTHA